MVHVISGNPDKHDESLFTWSPSQVLYHFAVGKASVDPRLLSLEAYQHLQETGTW